MSPFAIRVYGTGTFEPGDDYPLIFDNRRSYGDVYYRAPLDLFNPKIQVYSNEYAIVNPILIDFDGDNELRRLLTPIQYPTLPVLGLSTAFTIFPGTCITFPLYNTYLESYPQRLPTAVITISTPGLDIPECRNYINFIPKTS
jgi:hypothetical protein